MSLKRSSIRAKAQLDRIQEAVAPQLLTFFLYLEKDS